MRKGRKGGGCSWFGAGLTLGKGVTTDGRTATVIQGDVRKVRRDATHPALLRVYRAADPRARGPLKVLSPKGNRADDPDPARAQIRLFAGGDPAMAADLRA